MRVSTIHKITAVNFEDDFLVIISENKTFKVKLEELSEKLLHASEQERNNFLISPSGYGIHWPTLNEDISLQGIINKGHTA